MVELKMKTLVGMTIEKWAQSPVTSDMVRPYPVEKEEIILVFLDGSNVTIKETEDGSGQVVWEWSEDRRPFSCRPIGGPMKVRISEDMDYGHLEILKADTCEAVLLTSKEEVGFCEYLFEKTPRMMEGRPVWIFAGASGLGKSTLGRFLELQGKIVYETDSDQRLPNMIMADVIVVGNRNKSLVLDDICARLPDGVEPIFVEFSLAGEYLTKK
jgi:hypothetical protein